MRYGVFIYSSQQQQMATDARNEYAFVRVLGCAGPVPGLMLVALKIWYATQSSLRLGCCHGSSTVVDRDHHGGHWTVPDVCG